MNFSSARNMRGSLPFALVMAFALLILAWRFAVPGVSADGTGYLQIARNVLSGNGLGWEATWYPPLHSLQIAAAAVLSRSTDLLRVVPWVGLVMGLLLAASTWFLGTIAVDRRVGTIAAILTVASPHILFITYSTEPEISYTAWLTLSLCLFLSALLRESRVLGAAAGLSFMLAWLGRSEGFVVLLLLIATALLVTRLQRRILAVCAACLIVFLISALPYLFFLRGTYGNWVFSPKTSYVLIWMKGRIYHDHDIPETQNPDLWGLTPDGEKLRWQEPKGVGYLVSYLAENPGKSARVYLRNLGMEIPGRIPNNSGMERFPQLFPVYLAAAAVFGAFVSWGAESRRRKVILAPFLLLFIFPFVTEGWWKYLVPYLPLFLVAAAAGIVTACDLLASRFAEGGDLRRALPAVAAAAVALRFLLPLLPMPGQAAPQAPAPARSLRLELAEEARKAGEWAAQRFGPGRRYLIPWSKMIYYLNGVWIPWPVAEYPDVLRFAKNRGADFLVLEMGRAPGPEDVVPPPGTSLAGVYVAKNGGYSALFFSLR